MSIILGEGAQEGAHLTLDGIEEIVVLRLVAAGGIAEDEVLG